jgi:Spy/CpxP family protein refolding chaperone
MRFMKTVATALVLTFAAAPAIAAPVAKAPLGQAAAPAKHRKAGKGKRFERAGISKQKAEQIKKAMEKFKAQQQAIREDMKKHRAELRKLLKADSDDQAAYKQALDGMAAGQKKRAALRVSRQKELAKILTPKELAKLLSAGPRGRGGEGKAKGHRGGKQRAGKGAVDAE